MFNSISLCNRQVNRDQKENKVTGIRSSAKDANRKITRPIVFRDEKNDEYLAKECKIFSFVGKAKYAEPQTPYVFYSNLSAK